MLKDVLAKCRSDFVNEDLDPGPKIVFRFLKSNFVDIKDRERTYTYWNRNLTDEMQIVKQNIN